MADSLAGAALGRPPEPVRLRAVARTVASLFTPPTFAPEAPTHRGLRYRRGLGPRRRVDVYLPDGPGPHPSVAVIHGGGFLIGSRRMKPARYLATRLVQAGYAVGAFDYRLLIRGTLHLDRQVADVRAALGWWHEQGRRFRLDPRRTAALGLSAGGTLLLLATAGGATPPLAHLVSVFSLYDLGQLSGRLPAVLGHLLHRTGDRAVWTARSPLAQAPCPVPMTLLHGTADGLTPLVQAERFAELRRQAGLPTRLHVYPGAPHGFFNEAASPTAQRATADLLAALANPPD